MQRRARDDHERHAHSRLRTKLKVKRRAAAGRHAWRQTFQTGDRSDGSVLERKQELAMKYVPLGRSGLQVSRLALGCMSYGSPKWRPWVLEESAARPFFQRAVEAGINFFDT